MGNDRNACRSRHDAQKPEQAGNARSEYGNRPFDDALRIPFSLSGLFRFLSIMTRPTSVPIIPHAGANSPAFSKILLPFLCLSSIAAISEFITLRIVSSSHPSMARSRSGAFRFLFVYRFDVFLYRDGRIVCSCFHQLFPERFKKSAGCAEAGLYFGRRRCTRLGQNLCQPV